jgi:hypothetical protein
VTVGAGKGSLDLNLSLADSLCGAGDADVVLGAAEGIELEKNERKEIKWMEEE